MSSTATPKHVTIDQLVGEWELDAECSEILIGHKTMWGLMTVRGHFGSVTGSGSVSIGGVVTGSVTIDTASLDTGNKTRDDHLGSNDFFDAQQFPTMDLRVSTATLRGVEATVRSVLTVKGASELLTFTGQVEEATAQALTVSGTFTVDRDRFGMSWNRLGMMKGLTTVSFRLIFRRVRG